MKLVASLCVPSAAKNCNIFAFAIGSNTVKNGPVGAPKAKRPQDQRSVK